MKKGLKVLIVLAVIVALFIGGIFGFKAYSDYRSKKSLQETRERTRDALAQFEYTVPEGFEDKATGESYEYQWWIYREGAVTCAIDFFSWERETGRSLLDEFTDDYKSDEGKEYKIISPLEDIDIDGIPGRRVTTEQREVSEEWGVHFVTRETIYYLETEDYLLRITYGISDDNMFEGDDGLTEKCFADQKAFFDSLKKK